MRIQTELRKRVYRCAALEELFELWTQAHKDEENYWLTSLESIEQNSFNADGYIYKDKYETARHKILFILKEANIDQYRIHLDSPEKRNQRGFYSEYIENNSGLNIPKQQEKMGRMAFYITNKGSISAKTPNETELKNALAKSAFMNLNKRGGANSTDNTKFELYIKKYEIFIKKQIEILKPDYIVILGKSYANHMIKEFGAEKSIEVIEMWHTSYRMSRIKRNNDPLYSFQDKNVDCYMRNFFGKVDSRQ